MTRTDAGIGVGGSIAFVLGLGASLSPVAEPVAGQRAGEAIQDCELCPEMVVVPAGSFTMGSPGTENGRFDNEGPQHRVTINYEFAVGIYEVSFDEWEACTRDGGCRGHRPSGSGRGLERPIRPCRARMATRTPRQPAPSSRTPSACMTCWATCGNGRRIVGTTATQMPRAMGAHGEPGIVPFACCAAVPGSPLRGPSVRRSAAGPMPAAGIPTSASVSPEP